MSFERPLLLLTLLVVPVVVGVYLLAERRRMRYAIRFTNLDVLASVVGRRRWPQFLPLALFLLALTALCVGMARPHRSTLVPRDRATVILVVDVSRSMEARDVKPTRLGAAAEAVRTFLDRVPDRLQIALIAFAGEPAVAVPPTSDHRLLHEALSTLRWFPSYGGTAIGDALAEAVRVGQEAIGARDDGNLAAVRSAQKDEPTKGLVSILFLSDGAQTRGELLPLEGAARAKAVGIPIYTVALGTPHGTLRFGYGGGFGQSNPFGGPRRRVPVPPDPETLRAIAAHTGGQFFEARDAEALNAAYSNLGSRLGRQPGETEITYGFLAGAAVLLLAAGLLSARWSPRLP